MFTFCSKATNLFYIQNITRLYEFFPFFHVVPVHQHLRMQLVLLSNDLVRLVHLFLHNIHMFLNQSVTLADLLLMFLYLEVLAMVRVFWNQQSISITLPLLIAITALARFIILQGKEMDPTALVYEAVAILLIAGAIVVLRLRHSDKLGLKKKKSR